MKKLIAIFILCFLTGVATVNAAYQRHQKQPNFFMPAGAVKSTVNKPNFTVRQPQSQQRKKCRRKFLSNRRHRLRLKPQPLLKQTKLPLLRLLRLNSPNHLRRLLLCRRLSYSRSFQQTVKMMNTDRVLRNMRKI